MRLCCNCKSINECKQYKNHTSSSQLYSKNTIIVELCHSLTIRNMKEIHVPGFDRTNELRRSRT